jgi:predicted membrane-bound spermidine synthase
MAFAWLECSIAGAVLLSTLFYDSLPGWYAALYWMLAPGAPSWSAALAQAGVASLVVLPGTLAMGALFPIAVRAYAELLRSASRAEYTVGRLYALNTLGGIAGSFLAGVWLLPTLGIWKTALVASGASLVLGAVAALASAGPLRRRLALPAGAAVGVLALSLVLPPPDLLALNRGMYMVLANRDQPDPEQFARYDERQRMLFYREGINASVAVTANIQTGALALRLAGKPVADTTPAGRAHLVFLGQLPLLFAPNPRRVAVIGLGIGITTASVLSHDSVESVDVIELERAVVDAGRYFAHATDDVLADPRLRLVIEDGRTFLGYAGQSYDVLTTDPISPVVAGAANLYTRDFYEMAKGSLSPGGIFCQWIDTWSASESTYRGVLASIRSVFPHLVIFHDGVVLASDQPIRVPWEVFEARFDAPDVRRSFEAVGIDSAVQLFTLFLAAEQHVDRYVAGVSRLNTDDDNWLERQMPADLRRPNRPSLNAILQHRFTGRRVASLPELLPGMPLSELAQLVAQPGQRLQREAAEGWASELLAWFRRGDATEQVEQMLAWQRDASKEADSSGNGYARLVRSARRAHKEQQEEAAQLLLEVLAYPYGPHYYEAGLALAQIHARHGRHEEALRYTRLMRGRAPARAAAYVMEVQILASMGRPALARRVAEEARLFELEHPELERLFDESG